METGFIYCGPCRKQRERERQQKNNQLRQDEKNAWAREHKAQSTSKRSRFEPSGHLVIIRDVTPVDDGGFRPGAVFNSYDMQAMLQSRSLSSGTKIRNTRNGRVFVVLGAALVAAQ